MNVVKPANNAQKEVFKKYKEGRNLVMLGLPGTGKTLLAIYLAAKELEDKNLQKIIIVRAALPSENIGHLPGTYEEKIKPYEIAYEETFRFLHGDTEKFIEWKDKGKLEIMNSSFVRGVTWDNAFIIIDECQNLTYHQIRSIITRTGKNSRLAICGDYWQSDLGSKADKDGVLAMTKVLSNLPNYFHIERFDSPEYIERSPLVKAYILAEINEGLIK